MDLQHLDPKLINWPDVRVTAYYQEGQEEMLAENLRVMGQQQPIVVIKVGDKHWGTDGLHRWKMAVERGDDTIPCVVREGEEKDVQMSNLVLNSLRGRTKASEQVEVLGSLFDDLGVSIEELVERTGHSRDWVEQMITVSRATPLVRQVLDDELISLGHAYELARIENTEMQERTCQLLLTYRWSIKTLREHIKNAQAIGAEPGPAPAPTAPQAPAKITCGFCHVEEEPKHVTNSPVCVSCAGLLMDAARARAAGS